jgi:hypothetical protein
MMQCHIVHAGATASEAARAQATLAQCALKWPV